MKNNHWYRSVLVIGVLFSTILSISTVSAVPSRCTVVVKDREAQDFVQWQTAYCLVIYAPNDKLAEDYCDAVAGDLQNANASIVVNLSLGTGVCSASGALAGCRNAGRSFQNTNFKIDQYYYLSTGGAEATCTRTGGTYSAYRR